MYNSRFKFALSGFTLIEIIIVIAIIGFLVTVGLVSFDNFREQARDKVRAASLKELQVAIELYKSTYGKYPRPGCDGSSATWKGPGPHSAAWGRECPEYVVGLVPEFLPALPTDPSMEDVDNSGFIYWSNTTDYKVLVHGTVESVEVTSYQNPLARCPRSCQVEAPNNGYCDDTNLVRNQYAIYSKGAICH